MFLLNGCVDIGGERDIAREKKACFEDKFNKISQSSLNGQ